MIQLQKIDYADCYQGLIKLVLLSKGFAPEFMNIRSFGFCYDEENAKFDIPHDNFKDVLYRYYGITEIHYRNKLYDEYVAIISRCLAEKKIVFLKINVCACTWNKMSNGSKIPHFLLVTEIDELTGIISCIDIFYSQTYQTLDIKKNIEFCIKAVELEIEPNITWNLQQIILDLSNTMCNENEPEKISSEQIRRYYASEDLKKYFLQEHSAADYSEHIMSCKRIIISRQDIWNILKKYVLSDEGIQNIQPLWEENIQGWNQWYNLLLKKQIVPKMGERLLEKSIIKLENLADNEEKIIRETTKILQSHILRDI